MKLRPLLIKLHLWVALTAGVFLLLLGATGAMLVFHPLIDRVRDPELLQVTAGEVRLPLQGLVNRAGVIGTPAVVIVPRGADESLQVFVLNEKKKPVSVWLNPYTGAILGSRTVAEQQQGLMLRTRAFHRTLLQGKNGGKVVGFMTIMAIFMACTGLVLWWPRKIVKLRTGASFARINFDLHNVVGVFSSIMLLVLSMSGVVIAYPQVGKLLTSFDATRLADPELPASPNHPAPLSLDSVATIAARALPGSAPSAISLPRSGSAVIAMSRWYPENAEGTSPSRIWLNVFTGAILRVDDSRNPAPGTIGSRLRQSILWLHVGLLFGWVSGTLVFLGSASQVVLVVTGFLIWWKRTFRTPRTRAASAAGLLALCLAVPVTVEAQAPSDNAVRAVLRRRVDSGNVKGMIVGIIDRSGRQRIVSYGTSDVEGLALGERTVFELGSLTKTFTATILVPDVTATNNPAYKACGSLGA